MTWNESAHRRDQIGRFTETGKATLRKLGKQLSGIPKELSEDDARTFLRTHYAGWRKGLTTEEDRALTFYQSPGYGLMNAIALGKKPDGSASDVVRAKKAVKALDTAIAKAPPLPRPLLGFRGMPKGQFGELRDGAVVSPGQYVSVSLTRKGATAFRKVGKQINVEVVLPKGTRAAGGSVKELVLPRNVRFRVRKKGSRVTLEVLP